LMFHKGFSIWMLNYFKISDGFLGVWSPSRVLVVVMIHQPIFPLHWFLLIFIWQTVDDLEIVCVVLLLLLHWVCSYSVLSVMLHLFPLGICKFKHAYLVNCKLQNTLFYRQSKIEIASHLTNWGCRESSTKHFERQDSIQATSKTKTRVEVEYLVHKIWNNWWIVITIVTTTIKANLKLRLKLVLSSTLGK
jgi:hypothetical protein